MECEEKCFTVLWKIENISYCLQKKGEVIESPMFVVDATEKTKWKLQLFPRGDDDGNNVAYFLARNLDSEGEEKVEMKYKLEFVSKDGTALRSLNIENYAFPKGEGYGFPAFQKRVDIFLSRRSEFLPEDTLRARCKIWKVVGKMTEDVLCIARTCIGVEKRYFDWNVVNFGTLELEKKCTYQIKSLKNDADLMSVDLYLAGGVNFEEIIHFELTLQDKSIKFCSLRLFLIDASGKKEECNQDEFWFDGKNSKQFTFFFSKKKLMAKKSMYLPDDKLSLYWEFTFSRGVVFEEIEEVLHGSACSKSKIPDDQKVNNENSLSLSHSLNDSLKSLYDKQFLCDVKLKTSTSTFPAHKLILSASSSVFNAMFSNDMKEKNSDCVEVEDLTDDAVRRLLLYIYTSRMDNITWESASHLYVAADKYAVLSLKNICSSYLKENLCPSNACELLLLADFHSDGELKCSVQDYILKRDKDIINSDEWKQLLDTNAKLAAETLGLRYK